jgi:ribose transport system permease protein
MVDRERTTGAPDGIPGGAESPLPAQEQMPAEVPGLRASGASGRWSPSRILATQGLLILCVVLVIVFAILLPRTYLTAFNIRSVLGTQSVTALLALGVMIPLAAGHYDLSIGYALGMVEVLTIGLQLNNGFPWPAAVAVAFAIALLIGLINGILVTVARIDSFIATLAVGTFVYGLTNWYSGGQQIAGVVPQSFTSIANTSFFGLIPFPVVIVAVIAIVMYLVLEYLPPGRRLYALGANPRMAELLGIPSRRYVIGSFICCGALVGIGGVVLASQLQAGQPDIGPSYLLPAFVGALLGATSVRPGRVNVGGTIIAVILIAVGVAGLQQLGSSFYFQYLFNGATRAGAVGLAGWASRSCGYR